MGAFGNTAVQSKPKTGGAKKGAKPVKTLRVKMADAEKSEYLTGLFMDSKQPEAGMQLSGKDKEGRRYIVYINEDGSGNLFFIPAGEKNREKLTGLFYNPEGQFGPYHSGKTQDGHRFYVADFKPRD